MFNKRNVSVLAAAALLAALVGAGALIADDDEDKTQIRAADSYRRMVWHCQALHAAE